MENKRKTKSIIGKFEKYDIYSTIINEENRLFIGIIRKYAYQGCLLEIDFKKKTYFIGKHPLKWLKDEGFTDKS